MSGIPEDMNQFLHTACEVRGRSHSLKLCNNFNICEVDYPVFQLLGRYSGETFPYGPGVCTRMFIAVLFLKTIKLAILSVN